MKAKVVIIILVFVLWGTGSTYWYVCKIKGLCIDAEEISNAEVLNQGNLFFKYGSSIPEINSDTQFTLDSIRSLQFDTLLITGLYYNGESKILGLKRARSIDSLIALNNSERPVRLATKTSIDKINGKAKAFELSLITNPEEIELKDVDFSIEKSNNKIIIYFPSASSDPHTNEELMTDLRSLSQMVIDNNSKIKLTGHTDNSGTHEVNLKFGRLRVDAIANLLIEFGVNSDLIQTASMGESEPIAANDTEAGKRKNRRVEILILEN